MRRKKTGWIALGTVVCVLAGAGIEHARLCLTRGPEESPVVAETGSRQLKDTSRPRTIVKKDEAAATAAEALRLRVAELEKALVVSKAGIDRLKQVKQAEGGPSGRPSRLAFIARMDPLKKERPEQYAEMEKRREEFRQRRAQQELDRADFLSSINTQTMRDAQRENQAKLLETIAKIDALRAQREQSGCEPGSEADAAFASGGGRSDGSTQRALRPGAFVSVGASREGGWVPRG